MLERMMLRLGQIRAVVHLLVDVVVEPVLTGFVATDEGMIGTVGVLARMLGR